MKFISESEGLKRLKNVKETYQNIVRAEYEPKAKNCLTCEVRGNCCTDAHFVNVHITRLEATAIRETVKKFDAEKQREIYHRIEQTVEKYDLKATGETFAQTFSCPLFEEEAGCLVHAEAKPAPCIQHACYENLKDLPPDKLQSDTENAIERLNSKTYGHNWAWLPLPLWLHKLNPFANE